MKKIFLVAVLAIASVSFMNAEKKVDVKGTYNEVKSQIEAGGPRAIGGNLGGFAGFSYQHGLSNGNMIDLAASFTPWGSFGVSVQATYDWVNPFNTQIPWDKKGEWNWAMGCGLAGYWWSRRCSRSRWRCLRLLVPAGALHRLAS